MTAICGWFEAEAEGHSQRNCQEILAALQSFGGSSPRVSSNGSAALGLSLFATLPEDAFDQQPTSRDGRLFVADVRLDNRGDLAARLGMDSDASRTASDGEIVRRAWLRWGEACLDYIYGDYAIAHYDTAERRLTLVRDPTGQRPLFFWTRRETCEAVAFASMPFGLLAVQECWKGFDQRQLGRMLLELPRMHSSSGLNGIERVRPGETVVLQLGAGIARSSWTPRSRDCRHFGDEEFVSTYRTLLDDAVAARLRRWVGGVAAHLSAGLDSNAVAATAALLDPDPLDAFTGAPREGFAATMPRGKIADESRHAALTAKRHGMRHHIIRSEDGALDHLRNEAATHQDPQRNLVNAGWLSAIDLAARDAGASVLLTGETGNLTLNCGSADVLADYIRCGRWVEWAVQARSAVSSGELRWTGTLYNSFNWLLPSAAIRLLRRFYFHDRKPADLAFARSNVVGELDVSREADSLQPTGDSATNRLQVLRNLDFGTSRKGTIANAHVDVRDPLADRRLIEFSLGLPPEQQFSAGQSRRLARRGLADRVPDEILCSRTRGYQAADWIDTLKAADVGALVEEISAEDAVHDVIDIGKIDAAIASWPQAGLYRRDRFAQYVGYLPAALSVAFFMIEAKKAAANARATTRR